jgi:hypothetical protein
MDRPLPNCYWVIPGRLLAGEYPFGSPENDGRTRIARLNAIRNARLNHFVDLTEVDEHPSYNQVLPMRVHYTRSAIPDTSVPASVDQVRDILATIRSSLALGRGIYLHCRAGIGRTGLIVGCYLAEESGDGKAAIKQLNLLWQQSERSKSWPKVPQTAEQAEYIRRWPVISKRRS